MANPAKTAVIQLTAPDGELGWTIVELQGSVVSKAGSLDGMNWGTFYHEEGVGLLRPPPAEDCRGWALTMTAVIATLRSEERYCQHSQWQRE